MVQSRLQAVGEEAVPELIGTERQPLRISMPPENRAESAFGALLLTSLKALSQRALVALASLVDLALIGSVFALCLMIVKEPSSLQLVEAAGYAVFIGSALWLRRE